MAVARWAVREPPGGVALSQPISSRFTQFFSQLTGFFPDFLQILYRFSDILMDSHGLWIMRDLEGLFEILSRFLDLSYGPRRILGHFVVDS